MIREAKFADGSVRRLEPATTPLMRQLNLLTYWEAEADAHHKAMRQAADNAQGRRRQVAAMLKAAGAAQCWSNGTLYQVGPMGELHTFDCPEAVEISVPAPEFTDEQIDESAYVQALVDAFHPDRIDEEVA